MLKDNFSKWKKWGNRNEFDNINFPGIYCIAISKIDINETIFNWSENIKYIGMTNSKGGLKSRLRQFDYTIIGKTGHGGADRFRFKHQNYNALVEDLYVAVWPVLCDVKSNEPKDLRIMGEVAKSEYDCFAIYVEKFGSLPEFNQRESPKYSLSYEK